MQSFFANRLCLIGLNHNTIIITVICLNHCFLTQNAFCFKFNIHKKSKQNNLNFRGKPNNLS